ncbi:2-dehydropantoate 2-reductase (Ketopantoate reductase) (KPA reductase) (KPR) [Xanthoria calcicola]
MGIIEEVNKRVFPDPAERPQYLLGVISHGVYTAKPFDIIHAGAGTIAIAVIPHDIKEIKPTFESSALYLLRTLTRSPVLSAVGFPPTDLLQLQLEKLVVNAIINPLTAIYGCRNGDLLRQPAISRVMRLLLAEMSLVIKSLPELQGVPNLNMRFDTRRLEAEVVGIATKTAPNKSSMLQDINRGGKPTEIEYITGYIVRRGEEVGIQCIMNYMIMQMVLAKQRMRGKSRTNLLPVEENDTD